MLSNTQAFSETASGFPTLCGALDQPLMSTWNGLNLVVWLGNDVLQSWQTRADENSLTLKLTDDEADDDGMRRLAALSALESCFAQQPDRTTLKLQVHDVLTRMLLDDGTALKTADGALEISCERLWQQPDLWLRVPGNNGYAQQHIMSDGRRHPRRAPKPTGTVYTRHIPWLERTLSFRVADIGEDLDRFHGWMNDPRVAQFWQEDGDFLKHRNYLESQLADPHTIPLIGCFDGVPFGYFEVYWAKENRLGAYYDANDYDRGWHVLIGEDSVRGRAWITAWLPSLVHYMFLDDHRTQRIVGEPRADHHQQIRNLEKSGFSKIKEFDFPHKRAMLVMLLREHFFADRLWIDRTADQGRASMTDHGSGQ
jgi:RimJ/RimL family protein N-acetyltransferase